MNTFVTVRRPKGPLRGSIALPPAKSVANRALILAALAGDLDSVSDSGGADDTHILRQLLRERPYRMHCGDGGTTLRFLLAWACVQHGEEHLITGSARLLERPHGILVDALRQLGAEITAVPDGFLVRGTRIKGGQLQLHTPASSQFISALLLVAPCFPEGLHLHWTGTRLSEPYVRMSLRMLAHYGIAASMDAGSVRVEPGPLRVAPFRVPADWSAAAFWYQMAAVAGDAVFLLQGLKADGLQGDEAVAGLFGGMVVTRETDQGTEIRSAARQIPWPLNMDLRATPDLFQPLACTLAALGKEASFTGLNNLPLKETDRLKAVGQALHALGCTASYGDGRFQLSGAISNRHPPPFDPQGDHRMAMALAPLALVCETLTLLHPEVVNKSYPGFWKDLEHARFQLQWMQEGS
jgi:3-phosphoshikimate 1-carboxyvinyltransferase